MKKLIVTTLLIAGFTMAMAGEAKTTSSASAVTKGALTITTAELAKYDGKNGNPAYIAVDGVVYDVSGIRAWKNGNHKGVQAGQDITKLIKGAPHGDQVLKGLKTVGKLVEKK